MNNIRNNNKFFNFLIKKEALKTIVVKLKETNNFYFSDKLSFYYSIKNAFMKTSKKDNYKATIEKIYEFLMTNLPDWFDGYNIDYLYKILTDNNINIDNDEGKVLYKIEIAKHFIYDNYPPRFLTSFDWPEKNGVPLCFKEMKETIEDDLIIVKYYFYELKKPDDIIEITQKDFK